MDAAITSLELKAQLASDRPPLIVDVRKAPAFLAAADMIEGALRRNPALISSWAQELPRASTVVAYCVHGHEVSQSAAAALRAAGIAASYLTGGIEEGWRSAAGPLMSKPASASTRWVTRERPKIDRIACPWLVSRFVDPDAEFLYVPGGDVLKAAKDQDAIPYDIAGVAFSHDGEACSFDALLKAYHLSDPALQRLAQIVRGADTARLDLAPQAAGLLAVSLGLSRIFADDHDMLRHALVLYDALYAWCKDGMDETHTWNPAAYAQTQPALAAP